MVAATLGMMRKANSNITFDQLRDLITYSSNIEKSESGYGGTSSKLIVKDLEMSFPNYGDDKIFGISGLSYGNYINFKEYNSSGGCAFGYQIYRRDYTSPMNFDRIGGVSGISGTNTGTCNSSAFNYTSQYFY